VASQQWSAADSSGLRSRSVAVEEEEEREIARISELEATRRGVAPNPEEVRPNALFLVFLVARKNASTPISFLLSPLFLS